MTECKSHWCKVCMARVHAEAITENAERDADDLADNSFDSDLDAREVAESKILDW